MEHRLSDTSAYLYVISVLLIIGHIIKSALLWVWDTLNYLLIIAVGFATALTVSGLECGELKYALALILFVSEGVLAVVLIRAIVTERKVKKVAECPKVVVNKVPELPAEAVQIPIMPFQSD